MADWIIPTPVDDDEEKKPKAPQKPKAPEPVFKFDKFTPSPLTEMGDRTSPVFQRAYKRAERERQILEATERESKRQLDLTPKIDTVVAEPYINPATGKWEQPFVEAPPPGTSRSKYKQLRALQESRRYEEEGKAFQEMLDTRIRDKEIQKATAPSYGEQLLNRFGRGYVEGGESILKGISLLNPEAATDPTTQFLYQSPQEKRQRLQKLLPINQYDESLGLKVAEGIGSSIPFLLGSVAGGPASPFVSSILGAASNAGSTYDDAIANGADESTARYAAVIGAVIGLGEAAGIGRLGTKSLGRFPFTMSPLARVGQFASQTGQEGVEEWVQESVSKILNNVNAKWVGGYDVNRAIEEEVWDSGVTGLLTGMIAGGGVGIAGRLATYADPAYQELKTLDRELKRLWAAEESEKSKGRFQTWLQDTVGDRIKKWGEARKAKQNLGGDPTTYFELLPSEREGQAPVLIAPGWFFRAVTGVADPSMIGGLSIPISDTLVTRSNLERALGNDFKFQQAKYAFDTLVTESQRQGLTTLALVSADAIAKGEGYHINHETFHSGQGAIGEWLRQRDPEGRELPFGGKLIHDSEWAKSNPAIRFMIDNAPEVVRELRLEGVKISDEDLLATELPAYVNSGQWFNFFESRDVADTFFVDYLRHLRDLYGNEPLDILRVTSRLEQEVDDLIQGVLNEPTIAGTSPTSQRYSQEHDKSMAAVGAARSTRGADRAEDERYSEGPSGALSRSSGRSDRQENLRRFLAGSEATEPQYHATTSDFDTFTRSRDLGYHFGTPRAANDRIERYGQSEVTKYYEPEYDKPGSNVGAYWLNTGKALDVPDVFVNGQPVTTVENFLRRYILETNPEINDLLKRAYSIYDKFRGMGYDRASVSDLQPGMGIVNDILLNELRQIEDQIQDAATRQFEAQGYNTLRYVNEAEDEGSISYAALRPEQIKSVTGNIGTYDPKEKSTLLSVTNLTNKPWYYFNFARAIDDPKLPPKMTVEQAEAMFRPGGRYSVRKDEWEWTIKPFLEGKRESGEKITKEELRKLAEESLPKVEEVVKGPTSINVEYELKRRRTNLAGAEWERDRLRDSIQETEELLNSLDPGDLEGDNLERIASLREDLEDAQLQLTQQENFINQIRSEVADLEEDARMGAISKTESDDTVPWSSIRAVQGGIPGTYRIALITLPNVPGKYRSHAFEEDKIVVWVRFNEHLDKDGNRVLTIQEIQSDWHQQGRERGYQPRKSQLTPEEFERYKHLRTMASYGRLESAEDFAELANLENRAGDTGIPDAPFKDTWHELAFKRMVRWAVDEGVDRIAWSTGLQQIRVNTNTLRREVDTMVFNKWGDRESPEAEKMLERINFLHEKTRDRGRLYEDELEAELELLHETYERTYGPLTSGGVVGIFTPIPTKKIGQFIAYKDGRVLVNENVDQAWLDKYIEPAIQKELFEKGHLDTGTYTIGGKFHKLLYDDKLTQVAKEIARKTGGRVEDVEIRPKVPSEYEIRPSDYRPGEYDIVQISPELNVVSNAKSVEEAQALIDRYKAEDDQNTEVVHSLTISPQLSEKARMEGFALSTTPEPLTVGDKVRMKVLSGVSKEVGTIIKIDSDEDGPYAVVQFKGAQEEIYLDRLVKDRPRVKAPEQETEPTAPPQPTKVAMVGDKVKVSGITDPVEVRYRATDGIIIQLPDGTRKTIGFNEIEEVVEKAPTRPPSTQPQKTVKQQVLADNPIVSEVNPAQMSLPGIEAPKRLVATPELPQSAQPQLPGMEESPFLFERRISSEVVKAVTEGFKALLETGGIRRDPTKRVFLQVHDAVLTGKIDPRKFANLLDENNLSIEDFVTELEDTASEAGRILGEYSRLSRYTVKFMKENPKLAKKVIPAKMRMQAVLADLEAGILGRGVIQRATGMLQGLILSDQLIAIRNIVTTLKRIPIMGTTHSIAAWVEAVNTGSQHGHNFEDRLAIANMNAMDALEPVAQIIAHMTPPQLRRYLKLEGKGSSDQYNEAIILLAKHFPHLERELAVPGFASDEHAKNTLEEAAENVELARNILKEMRVDVKDRDKYVRRFRVAERRLNSNIMGLGKALRIGEWPIEQMMKPMNLAEKFFRHPTFYGYLTALLKGKGWDIAEAIQFEKLEEKDLTPEKKAKRFRNIPEEDLKSAIDEALYLTHAYMPRSENSPAENAARQIIKVLNYFKPLAPATNLWFSRALYNSLKFTWEYVPLIPLMGGPPVMGLLAFPLGMVGPASRVMFPRYTTDPKTGEQVTVNPIKPNDYKRFAAGIVGTVMFTIANSLLEGGGGGDEWWQIETGTTGSKGEPLFIDIRGDMPLANWVRIADLSRRVNEGRLNDVKFTKELSEALIGMQRGAPEMAEAFDALVEMWSDGDETKETVDTNLGRRFSMLTKPFVNIRNVWAIFSEEENKRKDLKGTGFLGPLIDNLPYFRRSLPDLSPPTQEPPVLQSEYPLTQFVPGVKLVEGENFAGREWKRLGFYNRRFLQPDPDPKVNRSQNEMFRTLVQMLAIALKNDPGYQKMSDAEKAAEWEKHIGGDDGIAAYARQYALEQNPIQQQKEEFIRETEMGPLQRKAYGIDELIKEIEKNQK